MSFFDKYIRGPKTGLEMLQYVQKIEADVRKDWAACTEKVNKIHAKSLVGAKLNKHEKKYILPAKPVGFYTGFRKIDERGRAHLIPLHEPGKCPKTKIITSEVLSYNTETGQIETKTKTYYFKKVAFWSNKVEGVDACEVVSADLHDEDLIGDFNIVDCQEHQLSDEELMEAFQFESSLKVPEAIQR